MEKPILFNTAMVKAILEGKKTCTRRIIKRTPSNDEPCGYGFWKEFNESDNTWYIKDYTHSCIWWAEKEYIEKFSKYHVGDILYVRETWFEGDILDSNEDIVERNIVLYRTDDLSKHGIEGIKWSPSIHMSKRLARIFLEVTEVKVERLQDITEDGARKEGIREYTKDGNLFKYAVNEEQYKWSQMPKNPIEPFKSLWDSTVNKKDIDKYCWDANPWVWVITFEKINKDEVNRDE